MFHKKNEVEVRKITIDFRAGTVTVQSGNDRLTVQDAYNRLAAVLVEQFVVVAVVFCEPLNAIVYIYIVYINIMWCML